VFQGYKQKFTTLLLLALVYCITIAVPHQFPIANAGADRTVDERAMVKLNDGNGHEIYSIGHQTLSYVAFYTNIVSSYQFLQLIHLLELGSKESFNVAERGKMARNIP
jgi:hypothetical protein